MSGEPSVPGTPGDAGDAGDAGAAARPAAPRVTLVIARARNGTIGRDNRLPWHLPEDLKHFRRLTMGSPIVMGRRTWESIGRPLPGRRSVVVSRTPGYAAEGAEVVGSLAEAIERCADAPEVFVIGGAQLYEAALPVARRAVMTEIDADIDGDRTIAPLDAAQWQAVRRDEAMSESGLRYAIVDYVRRAPDSGGAQRAGNPAQP